ncbi:MAG TPA: hypothetical protein DCX46_00155 [Bacteroidetes bacterium]|nr:hypothetical protein [Bacteroidota bacterium]
MEITKAILSNQLLQYLNHRITKDELISWCELNMLEGSFESGTVQEAVAKIGLMDAQNFDLSYEDLYLLLKRLGYQLKVDFVSEV